MFEIIIRVIISYLLGSLSGSLLIGKLKGVDIRKQGSGNAGGTNALRTQGILFAFGVVLIDIGKGVVAVLFVAPLGAAVNAEPELLAVLCGAGAILGHVYPVFFGFKGGKGAGTAIGAVAAIHLAVIPWTGLTWVLLLILTGFVGLATMVAGVSLPVYGLWLKADNEYYMGFTIALALFFIFTHRTNISRMIRGTEHRFEKIWLFKNRK